MNTKCSICGEVRKSIRFKTGYVCEKCLKYIRNTGSESPGGHILCSINGVNGSEGKTSLCPGIGHNISSNQTKQIVLTRKQE